ncbi:MAG: hypothetical protein V1804_04805 [Patescibacteria group bacterium]
MAPPSGFGKKAVNGALEFVGACYEDLQKEVKSGKYATLEEAIEIELAQIRKALSKMHIDAEGNLTEKKEL